MSALSRQKNKKLSCKHHFMDEQSQYGGDFHVLLFLITIIFSPTLFKLNPSFTYVFWLKKRMIAFLSY